MAKNFENIKVGGTIIFRNVALTEAVRNRHVELYGEELPSYRAKTGIIPTGLIISVINGLIGKSDWLAINFIMTTTIRRRKPIKVGDKITVKCRIIEATMPQDLKKNYGVVKISQDALVEGEIVCTVETTYAIFKKQRQHGKNKA